MSYDEAYRVITWAVAAIAGIPSAWIFLDWWRHRGDRLVTVHPRVR